MDHVYAPWSITQCAVKMVKRMETSVVFGASKLFVCFQFVKKSTPGLLMYDK